MASRVSPNFKCWHIRTHFSPCDVPSSPLRNSVMPCNSAFSSFKKLRVQRVKRVHCAHFDDENSKEIAYTDSENMQSSELKKGSSQFWRVKPELLEPSILGIIPEAPSWPERDEILRLSFERKVNIMEIPLSIRMIKKKLQLQKGLKDTSDLSTYCSVKKAFSSMLFTIHELQHYAFKTRESLCQEDLQGVMAKLQSELDASFVWLFQKIFCKTPTLMLYLMVLLANFTVFSLSSNTVISVTPSSMVSRTLLLNDNKSKQQHSHEEGIEKELTQEEEVLWNSIVEEASILLQKEIGNGVLEHETMKGFVAPLSVKLEGDSYEEYVKTELYYKKHLRRMPNNSLLLSNYAHFLYLVVHDLDRAEEYYRRSVLVESPEAEAFSRYADFLWLVRKDNWAAELRYLQALESDPDNTYCSSKYASFLWSTGGQDSNNSFPIEDLDNLQI